jgi:hypothetical protein
MNCCEYSPAYTLPYRHFHPSLIFVGKAGAYFSKPLVRLHYKGRLHPELETNTLAYPTTLLVTTVKSFTLHTLRPVLTTVLSVIS